MVPIREGPSKAFGKDGVERAYFLHVQNADTYSGLVRAIGSRKGKTEAEAHELVDSLCILCWELCDRFVLTGGKTGSSGNLLAVARSENERLRKQIVDCNRRALKQVQSVNSSVQHQDEGAVDFYEPLQYLDKETRELCVSIILDKIEQLASGNAPSSLVKMLSEAITDCKQNARKSGVENIGEEIGDDDEDDDAAAGKHVAQRESRKEKSLRQMIQEKEAMEEMLGDAKERESCLQEHLKDSEDKITKLEQQLQASSQRAARAASELSEMKSRLEKAEAEMARMSCSLTGSMLGAAENKSIQTASPGNEVTTQTASPGDEVNIVLLGGASGSIQQKDHEAAEDCEIAPAAQQMADRVVSHQASVLCQAGVSQLVQTNLVGENIVNMKHENKKLKVMLEEMKAKLNDLMSECKKKGLGDVVREICDSVGLGKLLTCRSVFEKLYQDALDRVHRLQLLREKYGISNANGRLHPVSGYDRRCPQNQDLHVVAEQPQMNSLREELNDVISSPDIMQAIEQSAMVKQLPSPRPSTEAVGFTRSDSHAAKAAHVSDLLQGRRLLGARSLDHDKEEESQEVGLRAKSLSPKSTQRKSSEYQVFTNIESRQPVVKPAGTLPGTLPTLSRPSRLEDVQLPSLQNPFRPFVISGSALSTADPELMMPTRRPPHVHRHLSNCDEISGSESYMPLRAHMQPPTDQPARSLLPKAAASGNELPRLGQSISLPCLHRTPASGSKLLK